MFMNGLPIMGGSRTSAPVGEANVEVDALGIPLARERECERERERGRIDPQIPSLGKSIGLDST